jgi:hypothetical protein
MNCDGVGLAEKDLSRGNQGVNTSLFFRYCFEIPSTSGGFLIQIQDAILNLCVAFNKDAGFKMNGFLALFSIL